MPQPNRFNFESPRVTAPRAGGLTVTVTQNPHCISPRSKSQEICSIARSCASAWSMQESKQAPLPHRQLTHTNLPTARRLTHQSQHTRQHTRIGIHSKSCLALHSWLQQIAFPVPVAEWLPLHSQLPEMTLSRSRFLTFLCDCFIAAKGKNHRAPERPRWPA